MTVDGEVPKKEKISWLFASWSLSVVVVLLLLLSQFACSRVEARLGVVLRQPQCPAPSCVLGSLWAQGRKKERQN